MLVDGIVGDAALIAGLHSEQLQRRFGDLGVALC